MATRKELEELSSNTEGLAKMAELLGYRDRNGQLTLRNGAHLSSLADFFDDNPGAAEAVIEWAMAEGSHRDGTPIADEEAECAVCGKSNHNTTEHDDSCPTCGCAPGDGVTPGCKDTEGCGYLSDEEDGCPGCGAVPALGPVEEGNKCPNDCGYVPVLPTGERITLKAEPQEGGCPCHGMDNCPDRSGLS